MVAGQGREPGRVRGLQSEVDHAECFVRAEHALVAEACEHDGDKLLLYDLDCGLVKVHSRDGLSVLLQPVLKLQRTECTVTPEDLGGR